MRSMSKISMAAMVAVAGTFALSATAKADGPTLGGYVQGSYQKNLNKPKTSAGAPTGNQLRVFDQNQSDDFGLNAVQLKLSKSIGDENYGYGVKLLAGDDARILNGNGTYSTSNDQFYVEEAYGMFSLSNLKALTVTGGRFVTAEGVEVIESPLNMNISEGLLFGYAEPFTHTGVKANYVVSDMANVTAGIVNGWDNSNTYLDNNRGKTIIYQVATTPAKGLIANLSGTYGPEASNQTHQKRTSVDLVLGYTGIEKLTINGQLNWGQDKQKNTSTNVWKGAGLWLGYAVSDWINPAVRYEVFSDQHGGSRTATAQTVNNFTLTNKFQVAKNMFLRAEYRHDWSNMPAFQNKVGNAVRVQNTIGADWVVTF